MLTALSNHPEFLTSEGLKVRTPVADLVATSASARRRRAGPVSGDSWANAANYIHGGDRLFSWPRPDGPPITGALWSAASRVFNSYGMHQNLARRLVAQGSATYRTRAAWLPAPSLRFDAYVDHLCRTWLGRTADARLLQAATQAVTGPEMGDRHRVDHGHQQALTGELAVPAAGQRPPRHPRPHDDVRQTMTEHTHTGGGRLLPRLRHRACRGAHCCRAPRQSAAAWPSRRCSATR